MVNGLNLGQFLSNRPGPVQRDTSNPFADLGEYGLAMARGRRADEQQAMQQRQLDESGRHTRVSEEQQAQQLLMGDRRAGQREDLYRTQENRRESQAQFERSKLRDAEHEQLIHELFAASSKNDPRAIQYAIDALHRAGYDVGQIEHQPPPEPGAAPYDPTLGGTLQAEDDGSGMAAKPLLPGQMGALPQRRTSAADARTRRELDAAEADILPKLLGKPMTYEQAMAQANKSGAYGVKQVQGGWVPLTHAEDQAADANNARDAQTSAELDAAEADILPKLSGVPAKKKKKLLPGQDIVLGSGDSYNKL